MNGDASASFPTTLLVTAVALAFVLALAWLAIRLLARTGAGSLGRGGRLKVMQSVPVGTRERVVLVEFDGEELLLGVTAGRISTLREGGKAPPKDAARPPAERRIG